MQGIELQAVTAELSLVVVLEKITKEIYNGMVKRVSELSRRDLPEIDKIVKARKNAEKFKVKLAQLGADRTTLEATKRTLAASRNAQDERKTSICKVIEIGG